MFYARWALIVLLLGLSLTLSAARADEASASATLKAKGISKTGVLSLPEEAELAKKLRDDFKLKKAVQAASLALQAAVYNNEQNEAAMIQLNQKLIQANQAGDAAANNQIVAELNLRQTAAKSLDAAEREARGKANQAREDYVTFVVESRRLADAIKQKYQVLASDKEVEEAIADLNTATGKKYALVESKALEASLKTLKRIEDTVLSDEIALTRKGNVFTISVVVNGKHNKDMMLDSGASLICLPEKLAKEWGIEIPDDAPTLHFKLADGSIVDGKQILLKSVRVGRFEVEEVECGVLDEKYPNADPLLGMSFLQNFNFKIDADVGKLTMTKVDDPGAKPAPGRPVPKK